MSELTLLIMRIGFMVLLWLFIFSIVYALRSDLFGAPVRKMPVDASAAPPATPPAPIISAPTLSPILTPPSAAAADTHQQPVERGNPLHPAKELVITSGVAAGTTIPLDDDIITIGRSSDSTLVIVDEYTSTYHARLQRNGSQWMLTDLDSTNGTTLDGERVYDPVMVPLATPIKIGTTTFELRS